MLLKKVYEPTDLDRYNNERESARLAALDQLEGTNIPPEEREALAMSMVNKMTFTPPQVDYLVVANTGTSREQNFSVRMVTELLHDGFMELRDNELFLKTHPEELRYTVTRMPGRYCLHCGEKLNDDPTGALARLHIQQEHALDESPDPNNPSGYIALNHFETVLNQDQHSRWSVQDPARAPVFILKDEE